MKEYNRKNTYKKKTSHFGKPNRDNFLKIKEGNYDD